MTGKESRLRVQFQHAETFRQAYLAQEWVAIARNYYDGPFIPQAVPIAVLQAQSAELYLKALWAHELGVPPRTHNLHRLYRKLPGLLQRGLERRFQSVFHGNPRLKILRTVYKSDVLSRVHLAGVLSETADLFAKWRYGFEYDRDEENSSSPNHLKDATESIRLFVIEDKKYPWADNWMTDDWFYHLERATPERYPDPNKHGDSTKRFARTEDEPKANYEVGAGLVLRPGGNPFGKL